jgi:hypothetical protein
MGFIDDIAKTVQNTVSGVASEIQNKSQEVMTQLSVNNRIQSLEGKKTALLINIGQLIYDKYEKGDEVSEELIQEKVKEIVQLDKDIELAKAELAATKVDSSEAPKSQKAANATGYKPTPGFTCPHCGAPANSGKFYCVSCGGALKEATSGGTTNGGGTESTSTN